MPYRAMAGGSPTVRIIRQAELDLSNGGNAVSFSGGDAGLSIRLITLGKMNLLIFAGGVKTAIAAAGCTIGLPADVGIAGDDDMDSVGILFAFLNSGDTDDTHTRDCQLSIDGQTGVTRLSIQQYNLATGAGVNFAGGGSNIRGQVFFMTR